MPARAFKTAIICAARPAICRPGQHGEDMPMCGSKTAEFGKAGFNDGAIAWPGGFRQILWRTATSVPGAAAPFLQPLQRLRCHSTNL
jgi:hypothetical protein